MKYGSWNVAKAERNRIKKLENGGFSPLTARVLAGRGYDDPKEARVFLSACCHMPDPMTMKDMDKAARRVRKALLEKEHMAVFGDYDVDGITATCLLTEFLRSQGGRVTHYIPGRIEEGYGLNVDAISRLKEQGVSLIITVDCGITANEEAQFCKEIGVDLIITDHHECKDELPNAVAVVDPHRKDDTYPHHDLAGVGVAFKLAAAILGDQMAILDRFSDLLCLGTVADVMPLVGENRNFVIRGLKALNETPRQGIAALADQCGCDRKTMTAVSIGYTLAPRINAAGRMGQVELATELMLTQDASSAAVLAKMLCQLNKQRQDVEAEICREAEQMLKDRNTKPHVIVLAGENWHQGVVGIVASRMAEEYRCPAFLICLDGERGKASSRSFGGFNLFGALEQLSHLLESYGGHELAAGFTISRSNIDTFRQEIEKLAEEFVASGKQKAALEIDCAVEPWLLNTHNIQALEELEPCGAGCPKPVLYINDMTVDQMTEVGGGKHLRLRLSGGNVSLNAIFFSANILRSAVAVGDRVEVAFTPQINEFKGTRSVQLNVVDIRPDRQSRESCETEFKLTDRLARGLPLASREASVLLPERNDFSVVWRYLAAGTEETLHEELGCLSRKISRHGGLYLSPGKLWVCLQVLRERGLLTCRDSWEDVAITLCPPEEKANLEESPIMQKLKKQKAGD